MSTQRETAEFMLEQLGSEARVKSMFGEFALYWQGKVAGFLCDDTLFLKITPASEARLGAAETGEAYPGSKPYYRITPDAWEDADWLRALIAAVADDLPEPKPKKPRKSVT